MPVLYFGNESVIEKTKKDPGLNDSPANTTVTARKDLGKRVTTMALHETDGQDQPSRGMNLTLASRLWEGHSDEPPAWVEGDDDLLVQLVADHFGCKIGRPKNWKEG